MNMPQNYRFVRAEDGILAGVCKGIADAFETEVWVIRVLFLVAFFWFGTGLLAYLIAAVSLPRKDRVESALQRRILGVCSALAVRYDFEVGVVRFLACLFALSSFGLAIFLYVIGAFIIPKDVVSPVRRY